MSASPHLKALQKKVWEGSVPLEVRLASSECRTFEDSNPYLVQYPRLSYLPFLLPRLHSFFSTNLINPDVQFNDGWLSFDDVPLKWHYPVGLLYDLYSGAEPFAPVEPSETTLTNIVSSVVTVTEDDEKARSDDSPRVWKLTVHFTDWPEQHLVKLDVEGKYLHDAYINSVKEADFLRNGTGKVMMSLSKDDSTQLWESVQNHDISSYNQIYQKLLKPPGTAIRNIPIKFYLPAATTAASTDTPTAGSVRTVQSLVPAMISSKQPQTIGTALNTILPTLFPSRRRCLLAEPVLHGAFVPMNAPIEDLMALAAYTDGWLHVVIVMMG